MIRKKETSLNGKVLGYTKHLFFFLIKERGKIAKKKKNGQEKKFLYCH